MTAILVSAPGTLVVVRSGKAPTTGVLQIEGIQGGGRDVVISSFEAQAEAAAQIRPSIGGPHYLYAMGQKLTQMSVGLVAYSGACDTQVNGTNALWAFYERQKVSPENAKPIRLTFYGMTILAFVLGLRTVVSADNGFPITQMVLSLAGWVDNTTIDNQQTPAGASLPDLLPPLAG